MAAPMLAGRGLLNLFVRSGGKDPARAAKAMKSKGVKLRRKIRKPVLLLALEILQKASANAPVRTGALRASGRLEPLIQAGWGVDTGYRIVFGGAGTGVDYAAAVEYGQKAYLRPAVASVKPKARGVLVKVVKDTWNNK